MVGGTDELGRFGQLNDTIDSLRENEAAPIRDGDQDSPGFLRVLNGLFLTVLFLSCFVLLAQIVCYFLQQYTLFRENQVAIALSVAALWGLTIGAVGAIAVAVIRGQIRQRAWRRRMRESDKNRSGR